MNPRGTNSLSRRCGALMLLALGFVLASAPKQSLAGCLHPSLFLRGDGETGSSFFQMLPETGAMAADAFDLTAPPVPKKPPCPGGVCSKAPAAPLSPPTTILPPGGHDLATVERRPIATPPGASLFRPSGPLSPPEGPPLAIFHPPRPLPAPDHPAPGTAS